MLKEFKVSLYFCSALFSTSQTQDRHAGVLDEQRKVSRFWG